MDEGYFSYLLGQKWAVHQHPWHILLGLEIEGTGLTGSIATGRLALYEGE